MSAAQHQAFVLGNVSFMAFIFVMCFVLSPRRTKFGVFASCNLVFVATMFYAVALLDLSGVRSEVILAIMTELPVVLIVAWICLTLAGGFSSHLGAPRSNRWRVGAGCGRYWVQHRCCFWSSLLLRVL